MAWASRTRRLCAIGQARDALRINHDVGQASLLPKLSIFWVTKPLHEFDVPLVGNHML